MSSGSKFDIAVIGSGFGGSLMAMIARRLGRSVILLERGRHPRVVIGESSTPLSNLLLEDLTTRYDLPGVKSLTKWGTWQATHPELACGLKRGFSFFHHMPGEQHSHWTDRSKQLLVAASPHSGIADTHWYRADLDSFFVDEARKLGAEYLDEVHLSNCSGDESGMSLRGVRASRDVTIQARLVIDATGPHGFLHRSLHLGERDLAGFPATQALYSHFTGVKRIEELSVNRFRNGAPYPVDDAAVHHIFDGGWVWVLRFNNGITSAGVVTTDNLAAELGLPDGEIAWQRLLRRFPVMAEQLVWAKPVQPFRHAAQVGFRSASIAGPNWALLPSAAGFVDPLLSTGFPLNLLGIARLAEVIERKWGADDFTERLKIYASQTDSELLATARLVGALYANMGNFQVFTALSLLYFAAASYSETVRRLGKPHLASSFLLHNDPQFGPECDRIFERAKRVHPGMESGELVEEILQAIEPFDVAGLGRRDRENWYPVDAADLLRSAHKLEAGRDEVIQMLKRCGLWPR